MARTPLTSEFNFDGKQVTLKNDITYHDHFYRIQKALWPRMCAEVAALPVAAQIASGEIEKWELYRPFSQDNAFFKAAGDAALDAIVPLGYDRERLGGAMRVWLRECAEDAFEALISPDIYGPDRYKDKPSRIKLSPLPKSPDLV